jgi:C1A family cysteine protease
LALAFAHPAEREFKLWMNANEREYEGETEYLRRFITYLDNKDKVAALNKDADGVTYALNKFADWSAEEFSSLLGMKGWVPKNLSHIPDQKPADIVTAPATFNWCSQGKCTPVKDQGQCGSCWAFATTENIESVYSIKGRGLPVLAPQQIVDCDSGELGCGGGDPSQAYQYVKNQGGLDLEQYYPYRAVQGRCAFSAAHIGAKIEGEANGFGGSEQQMAANLASNNGAPYSILVDASSWQFYNGGILTAAKCGRNIDHAVQVVGYDMNQYWTVRNSWGRGWGESGFIRLQFGQNTCAIRTQVLTATL